MNTTRHTPEPWHRSGIGFPDNPKERTEWLYGPREQPDHQSGPQVAEFKGPRSSADAQRSEMCVNALAGIDNPEEAIAKARDALEKFSQHVKGRIPADSSDSIRIEGVHARRLVNALAALTPRP